MDRDVFLDSLLRNTKEDKTMAIYKMSGFDQELEVFEDRLIITPRISWQFIYTSLDRYYKLLKGKMVIPYRSITAFQFKKTDTTHGYIQFTTLGDNESSLEIMNDNSFFKFSRSEQNGLAEAIKNYIEKKIKKFHPESNSSIPTTDPADEISKYFALKEKGIITEEEFEIKKRKLLGM
jgi:hypothetical protein